MMADPWAEFRVAALAAPAFAAAPANVDPWAAFRMPATQPLENAPTGEPAPFEGFGGMQSTAAPNFGAPAEPHTQLEPGGYPVGLRSAAIAAQGIPFAGAAIPETRGMAELKQQYPHAAAGSQLGAGLVGYGALGAALPGAMGLTGGLGMRALMSGVGGGTAAATDQALREYAAPLTGQTPPNPSATLEALKLPSTGSHIADAAAIAAALGPVATGATSLANAVISPALSASAKLLASKGVNMTVGQMLGGPVNKLESAATSIPFSGIGAERAKTLVSFNRAAENEALAPLAIKDPVFEQQGIKATLNPEDKIPPGFTGRQAVHQEISKAYDTVYKDAAMHGTEPLYASLEDLMGDAWKSGSVSEAGAKRFASIIDGQVVNKFDAAAQMGQPLRGQALSTIDTELRLQAEAFRRGGGDDYNVSRLLDQARTLVHNEFGVQNPEAMGRLNAADKAWAAYARLRSAGASTAVRGEEGLITPTQLEQAALRNDKSYARTKFTEGDALLQGLARAGREVIPSKVPDSGTAERAIVGTMLGGGAIFGHPGLLAAPVVSQALYATPAQRLLTLGISAGGPQREAVAEALRRSVSPVSLAAQRAAAMQQALGASKSSGQ